MDLYFYISLLPIQILKTAEIQDGCLNIVIINILLLIIIYIYFFLVSLNVRWGTEGLRIRTELVLNAAFTETCPNDDIIKQTAVRDCLGCGDQ